MKQNFVLLGKSTYRKTRLLLYMARGLNLVTGKRICLYTKDDAIHSDFSPFEYMEGIDVFRTVDSIPKEGSVFCLYDLEQIDSVSSIMFSPMDTEIALYTTQDCEALQGGLGVAGNLDDDRWSASLVVDNFLERSKITSRSLEKMFSERIDIHQIHINFFNDIDEARLIDNGHNESLKIKHLSRDFKAFLFGMVESMTGQFTDRRERKRSLATLGRGI